MKTHEDENAVVERKYFTTCYEQIMRFIHEKRIINTKVNVINKWKCRFVDAMSSVGVARRI